MTSGSHFTKGLRALAFAASLFLIAQALDVSLGAAARRDPVSKVNWVFRLRGKQPDYVVLGSSRAYRIIKVPIMDSVLDGTGLNLGQDGASFAEIALLFDIYLRENDSRRVLLEVDEFGLDSASFSHPFHEFFYIPYVRDTLVSRALRDYFGARALLWRYVPLFGYAEFNDRIGLKSAARVWRGQRAEFTADGSAPSRGEVPDSVFDKARDTTYRVSQGRVRSLEHILDAARTRGIHVTMFTAPVYMPFQRAVTNREALLERYREIGLAHGATFITVSDSDIASDRRYFRDPRHLNREGSQLFSRRLGEALQRVWGPFTEHAASP